MRNLSNFSDYERLIHLNSYESGELLLHINDLAIKALESKSPSNKSENKEAN
jgi:hypothetical protein